MPADPQLQSAFATRLPAEIRDAIYLELWRSVGLRQHILCHGRGEDRHFCRWACITEYQVADGLQRDIEELRCRLGVPLGQDIRHVQDPSGAVYCRRLQSPWMNHWACGEQAYEEHGIDAVWGFSTGGLICWKKNRQGKQALPPRTPYLPMLLSCKLISDECLRSIYESTTFVFNSLPAIQIFLGHCAPHWVMERWPNLCTRPPGLFKYVRTLEISLSPDFPALVLCANHDLPGIEHCHDAYDFHWLRLDQFQKLQTLNIWISARSTTWSIESDKQEYNFIGVTEYDLDALGTVLAALGSVKSVTISMPLGPSVGPESGYVDGTAVRLYKRGAGDRFHPPLHLINPGSQWDNVIHTSPKREVRLSKKGGEFLVMKGL